MSTYANARWTDARRVAVIVDIDGARAIVPADPSNPDFAALDGAAIADADQPPVDEPTAATRRARRAAAEDAAPPAAEPKEP